MGDTPRSSIVYTMGLRARRQNESQPAKIARLAGAIGMKDVAWKDKLVAVKTHFGEEGSSSFPRPILIRPLVDIIAAGGGKPFLAETTTLYTGSRSNAVDHTVTAIRHGFGMEVTGAPVFMCDGLTGRDHHLVPIAGKHFQEVSVAAGIFEADALVVVSHFKGHELTSFGGALKNLGMGCASRSAKLAMHTTVRPSVLQKKCIRCKLCFNWCSVGAIHQEKPNGPVTIDQDRCQGCGECLVSCRQGAIRINWSQDAGGVTERMVEHAAGVIANKKNAVFFINILQNIIPLCDCMNFSDAPIVPDIGFAASTDPVALDAACLDWVNEQVGLADSALKGGHQERECKFSHVHDALQTRLQLTYAEELNLGTTTYERIRLDKI